MIKIRKEEGGRAPADKGRGRDTRPPRDGAPVKFGKRPPRPAREADQGNDDAPFADKSADVAHHRFNDISEIDGQILRLLEKRLYADSAGIGRFNGVYPCASGSNAGIGSCIPERDD